MCIRDRQYSEQTRAESSFAAEQSDDYYEESDEVSLDRVSIDMADQTENNQ